MAYQFSCPECGQTSELETKPDRATVLCPACAKEVPLPRGKGKSGMLALILSLAAVLLAALLLFIFISAKAREAEKQRQMAKRKAEVEQQLRKEAKQKKVEEARRQWKETTKIADRSKLKTETDFVKALSTLKNYPGGDPDEKEKLIKQIEEYKAADISKIMAKLDAEAKTFGDQKKFMQAVGVYQDYDGYFKEETDKLRKKGAERYFDLEDQIKKEEELAKKKAEEEKKQVLKDLAVGLVSGKVSSSVKAFNASPYRKDLPEIDKMVNNLTRVNEIVMKTFEAQVGKKVPVALKGGKTTLLINKVEKGKVHAEFKKAKLAIIKKYSVKDMEDSEVFKRLGEYDKATAGLVGGVKAVRRRKYDEAEQFFQATGDFSIPLMSAMEEYKSSRPVEVKEEKVVKKVKLLPVEARKIKIAVKVTKGGKRNLNMGQVEENVTARINVQNTNQQAIDGYSLTVVLIGESLVNKKNYKPIYQIKVPLKLGAREKLEKNIPYKNNYNAGGEIGRGGRGPGGVAPAGERTRTISKSGYKYYSWIWVLTDPSGNIKTKKAKTSKFEKLIDKYFKESVAGEEKDNDKPPRKKGKAI